MAMKHIMVSTFLIVLFFQNISGQENAEKQYTNPVSNITGIGDPFVLTHDGVYYMYCTSKGNEGFYYWTSKDMVNWEKQGLALSNKTTEGIFGTNRFWAPEVVEYKGKFYMTYSAADSTNVMQLCLAVSDNPGGPFKNYQSPWYKHELSHIDATVFIDDDAKPYTYFVRDCSTNFVNGRSTSQIFVAQLSDDLKTFVTEPKLVITPDQPYEDINGTRLWNEGPFVLKHEGKYYMTYSANGYNTKEYCVAYATADSPFGPWVKAEENPILKANMSIGVSGPGHNSFAYSPNGKELFIMYHAHTFPNKPSGNRAVYIDRVNFVDGKMVVEGPTKSPQPYPSID